MRSKRTKVPCNVQRKRDEVLREALVRAGMLKEGTSVPMLVRLIVTVKTGTATAVRDWRRLAARLSLDYATVQAFGEGAVLPSGEMGGYTTVFDVSGAPDGIVALAEGDYPSVVSWEFACAGVSTDRGGAVTGQGAGAPVRRKIAAHVEGDARVFNVQTVKEAGSLGVIMVRGEQHLAAQAKESTRHTNESSAPSAPLPSRWTQGDAAAVFIDG